MNDKLDNISYGKPSAGLNPLKASQSSSAANIRTDIEETKSRLKILAERWRGINSVRGFLTELWFAMGLPTTNDSQRRGGNPSRYSAFRLKEGIVVTIRVSAHNADAGNYKKRGNVNGECNLSIVLQKRWHKNRFSSDDEVELQEYVYVDSKIAVVEDPLSQIALSLIGYLTSGVYEDTTGVAIYHQSFILKKPDHG